MEFSKKSIIFLFLLFTQLAISQINNNQEFRGIWVATVNNIDWPSSRSLSTEEQKSEIIKLLDVFKSLNFNAIIFQIRPSADAFYNSKYEPWSTYLTGTSDKSPIPYYDPLAFIISETHKRGMEFHAWLNPYRAIINYKKNESKLYNLINKKPEWFLDYGKNKYFNPGIPDVRQYTNRVVTDIVQNYNVDAIHFDDYFYPYKIKDVDFPDGDAFKNHGGDYYPHKLDDWRRNNVNLIIEELHKTIKTIKPWVQFGISPFGVWRNKSVDSMGSDTNARQTNYDDLYADVLLWLKEGWLDYILPQVYWHIGHEAADYETLVRWWAKNNYNTNLYIGHGLYRLGDEKQHDAWQQQHPTEIEKQLDLNNNIPQIKGSAYFSAKHIIKNSLDIYGALKKGFYKNPILPPTISPELFIPEPVYNLKIAKYKNRKYRLSWDVIQENTEKEAVKFIIYQFNKGEKISMKSNSNIITITGENHVDIHKKHLKNAKIFIVQAVSRNNNVSNPVRILR
jgi:uncharacterized lipoprotein YddW (UPF0748 family)